MSSPPRDGTTDPSTTPRPRRVWMINHHAGAPDEAAGTRHHALARQLVERGHAVTIFAGNFGGVPGRKQRLRRWQLARAVTVDGVRFVFMRTTPWSPAMLLRSVNMLSFLVVFLVVQAREARPALVIGSTVHPFAALGGWIAAKLRRARFAFEVRDLWPQTLVDLGALRDGSLFERGLRLLEAFLVHRAEAVITLLPGMRDYLVERGLPAGKVLYLPNGADLAIFDARPSPSSMPPAVADALAAAGRMRAEGRFVLGYLGAFGRVNRVDLVVQGAVDAEALEPGRVGVIAVGEGPERPAIVDAAGDSPAAWVGTPVPKVWVPTLLAAFDAAVVHTTYTPVYRYGISFNKLFEYMAAARPILFACDTAYDPMRASGGGRTIAPDSAEALRDAYLEFASMAPASLAAMGAAGRAFVQREHSMEHLGATLAGLVEAA